MRMPVFLQVVVDGKGESEVVAVFVVVTEDTHNSSPCWTRWTWKQQVLLALVASQVDYQEKAQTDK